MRYVNIPSDRLSRLLTAEYAAAICAAADSVPHPGARRYRSKLAAVSPR